MKLTNELEGLANGDTKSFSAIYDRFSLDALRIAVFVLNDREAASRVVEDVFMDVWNRREYWAVIHRFSNVLARDVLKRCIAVLENKAIKL